MLKVKLNEATNLVELSFKYNTDYINRLKRLPHAQFVSEKKVWTVPRLFIDDIEDMFEGEIMYMTPKWVIDGTSPPDYSALYGQIPNFKADLNPPYKPFPFQSFGSNFLVHFARRFGFSCLFDDMGTGKTIMSIYAGLILDQEENLLQHTIPTLVVCKSGLKYQWVTDGINKFTSATSIVIDGTKAKRKKQYEAIKKNPGRYEYVVVGYETIREDISVLSQIDIGLVISDEAHKIRNKDTQVNKAMRPLDARYFFFLTGSPISKEPSEIFGLGVIGNERYFGKWDAFKKEYMNAIRTAYGTEYLYKNLDKLNDKINMIALRRTEHEIDMEMPKIVESNVTLNPTKCQKDIDDRLLAEGEKALLELESLNRMPKTPEIQDRINKTKSTIKGTIALRVGCSNTPELFKQSHSAHVQKTYGVLSDDSSPKLDYLKEHVSEILLSGHKVVIFTKFETMTRIIKRELEKLKVNVCLFTGKMSPQEKERSRMLFKTDSNYNVFVSTNAGAEG